MRVMILRKADPQTEAGEMPGDGLLLAMGRYNEALVDAGVMAGGEGLKPSSHGARVTFRDGTPLVTQGPFAETRELLAGYTMLEVGSFDEALEWVKRWPREDASNDLVLEVRPAYALEDFPAGAGIDKHAELTERLRRQPAGMAAYLGFPGTCREAFTTYAELLGGTIEAMITHAETPAATNVAADWQDKIVHARLRLGAGHVLMGGDMPAGQGAAMQGFSVHLEFADPAQAERAFTQLAAGGSVRMPFGQTFWAHRFGMCVDRFGTPWMISNQQPA